ncbi:hypothetical protein SAMN05216364_100627 [Porphyromonadaceae bacterium KHP3R9]|nr:hypothetical protein SAMN05216364_100627 [Porphyromonadaceae bacterium KHP3R9]
MKIYNASGAEILDIQVDDSSVRYRSIMADDSLTLQFYTTGPVTVPRGAYVDFEGARYTLFYPENFKKNSTRDFAYTLVLHGNKEWLKFCLYRDRSAKPYRSKFKLTATPSEFIHLLIDNLNAKYGGGWSIGDCIEATETYLSFNIESCYDVLNRLTQEFSTEWEIAGKTIHFRKVEKFKDDPLPLSYGLGNGFKTGIGRQNDGDRQPIGQLDVEGGERNIDYSTYGSNTLLLPKSATLVYEGKTYRTDADGMYITRDGNTNIGEAGFDGSKFYPKRVGTVSHAIVVDADKHFYDIRDTSIPESLNYRDCRIPGEKATIVFQSGALAGREFDLEQTDTDLTGYIHAERRFKIVPAELDGQIMPGGVFVPSVGDKYAIFNIRMPEAYICDNATKTGASWDMFREAVKYFAEEENDKFSFTGELDGVWSRSRWLEIGGKIVPGGHILFSDPQFQPDGVLIRITAIKDYVNKPHKPEITLSNAPVSGSFSSDLGKLEAEEVVREADKKDLIRYSKRQWRDAKETMSMLHEALLNFSGSINPLTVQTMQLLVGDESLQFRFVNSKTNPQPVTHNVAFNTTTKVLTAAAGIIQHMTIGVTSLKKSHAASEYKYWDMTAYTSPALDPDKAFYLYARCATSGTTGIFLLSETAIAMESVAGQYHFLLGILNSEQDGDRSFAPLYGFTEILPGRVTTDRIVSQDGQTYFDLLSGIIGGRIKFLSSGTETDLEDWASDTEYAIILAENEAKSHADNVAAIEADLARMEAEVYADGKVTAEEAARIADAQAKLQEAKEYAQQQVDDLQIGGRNYYSLQDIILSGSFRRKTLQLAADTDYVVQTTIPRPSPTLMDCWAAPGPTITENSPTNGVASDASRIVKSDENGLITVSFRATHYDNVINGIYKIWVTKGNKATDWSPAPEDVQAEIDQVRQDAENAQSFAEAVLDSVADLDNYIEGVFKDGVMDAAEAKSIEKYINSVNEVMVKAEASYNKVYANPNLGSGSAKTNLLNAKVNLWGQRDALLSTINNAIADGETSASEKAAVDSAFSTFNSLMSAFQNALEEAIKTIQDYILMKAEDAEGMAEGAQLTASEALGKANTSKAVTDNFTAIEGGLITSTMIQLRPSVDDPITAGMSAFQDEGNGVAFWAGGTYNQAIAGTAKAIIRHDGTSKFTETEITGIIDATSGFLGTLEMKSGGYIDLPPTFASRKGRLDNAGLQLVYQSGNSQKIEWYSGLGTYAGQITCNSSGRMQLSSSFGVGIGLDIYGDAITITAGAGFYNNINLNSSVVSNIRQLLQVGILNLNYTSHSLSASTNYHLSTDTTLIVLTSVGDGAGIYRITNSGGSSPSNGDIKVIVNTSPTNYAILKDGITNGNIRVLLNGGPWFRILQNSIAVLVYYGGYWRIHTNWGQPG